MSDLEHYSRGDHVNKHITYYSNKCKMYNIHNINTDWSLYYSTSSTGLYKVKVRAKGRFRDSSLLLPSLRNNYDKYIVCTHDRIVN